MKFSVSFVWYSFDQTNMRNYSTIVEARNGKEALSLAKEESGFGDRVLRDIRVMRVVEEEENE